MKKISLLVGANMVFSMSSNAQDYSTSGYKGFVDAGYSVGDLSKARKRIETIFSQLTDQLLVIRSYAKITNGLFA